MNRDSGDWKTERLGSQFEVRYGRAKPTDSGEVPVIGSSGVYAYAKTPLVNFPTIVIGRKGSAGRPWLVKTPCHPSDTTFFLAPLPGKEFDLDFIFFALKRFQPRASDDVIPSLQKDDLENLEIPLPSPIEQRTIASALSKLQTAVETQENIVARLRELKSATMLKLFRQGLRGKSTKSTAIGLVPEDWDVQPLRTHCKVHSGGTPSRGYPAYWNGTIPWVKTGEINYRPISKTEERITNEGLKNSSAQIFGKGTVLMAMYGQGATRGKVAKLAIDAATNQACAALMPDKALDADFLYAYCVFAYSSIRRLGHGGNQLNLSAEILKQMPIPIPADIEEQREIVRHLAPLDSRLALAEANRDRLRALFSSMLEALMAGQVRATTPKLPKGDPHAF